MSVRPRGTSFQADFTCMGTRFRRDFDTLGEATEWETKVRAKLALGMDVSDLVDTKRAPSAAAGTAGLTLKAAGEDVLKLGEPIGWAGLQSEEKNRQILHNEIYPWFGESLPLTSINNAKVSEWIGTLEARGNSNATVNRKLATLSKVLRYAFKTKKAITEMPELGRKKEAQGRIRFITPAEETLVDQTFRLWGMVDVADFVTVLIDTGVRPGELFRLAARDLNEGNKTLSVWVNKTDLPRTVPATARTWAILQRHAKAHPLGALWPTLTEYQVRHAWDRMKAHLGLAKDDQFIPYACRHTCASRLVQRGIPLLVVKEWMGHKSIQTTMRYAHLAPTQLLDAVKVLEQEAA